MPKNTEARIQAGVVDYVRAVAPKVKIAHIPNGELRDKRTAAKLRWMGVWAGVPDLILLFNGRAIFWEVKKEGGKLTERQAAAITWLYDNGFDWAVIRSIDDARMHLRQLGIPTREFSNDLVRRSDPETRALMEGD